MLALVSTYSSVHPLKQTNKQTKTCAWIKNKPTNTNKSSKMWLWMEAVLDCGNDRSKKLLTSHYSLHAAKVCFQFCRRGDIAANLWDSTQHNALPAETTAQQKGKYRSQSYQSHCCSLTLCGEPFFRLAASGTRAHQTDTVHPCQLWAFQCCTTWSGKICILQGSAATHGNRRARQNVPYSLNPKAHYFTDQKEKCWNFACLLTRRVYHDAAINFTPRGITAIVRHCCYFLLANYC